MTKIPPKQLVNAIALVVKRRVDVGPLRIEIVARQVLGNVELGKSSLQSLAGFLCRLTERWHGILDALRFRCSRAVEQDSILASVSNPLVGVALRVVAWYFSCFVLQLIIVLLVLEQDYSQFLDDAPDWDLVIFFQVLVNGCLDNRVKRRTAILVSIGRKVGSGVDKSIHGSIIHVLGGAMKTASLVVVGKTKIVAPFYHPLEMCQPVLLG